MNNLSLYEFLSFLLPGSLTIFLFDLYRSWVFGNQSFLTGNNFTSGLMFLFLALLIGTGISTLNGRIFEESKWFKKLIRHDVQKVKLNDFTQSIIPYLNKEYEKRNPQQAEILDVNIPSRYLFDFAYFYLEAQDKIAQPKNFQSLYFMMLNCFIVCIISLPVMLFVNAVLFFWKINHVSLLHAFQLMIILIISILIIIPIANYLRKKMIERVFGNFYVECIYNLSAIKKNEKIKPQKINDDEP